MTAGNESAGAADARTNADAARRVRHAVEQTNGKTDGVDAELAVLIAAARGNLKGQLRAIRAQTNRDRAALLRGAGLRSYEPVTMVVAVVTFLLVALGPILTFRAVRSSGDYLVEDLQSAALASGIVMVIAAAWTLGTELFHSGRFGSRSGLYDSFVVALFTPWSLAGIAMVLFRAVEQGMYGAVSLGLGLQATALAAFVVTFIIARAHRGETARPERAAATATPERDRLRLERNVHRDVERVLSRADAADLDDRAVAIGMGELVRRGILSENRAAAVMRPM